MSTTIPQNPVGAERDIILTIYAYEHSEAAEVDVGHVMRDLDCSFYAPCELVQRHFVIGTDARAGDQQCVEVFIAALKASGLNIARWSFTTQPKGSGTSNDTEFAQPKPFSEAAVTAMAGQIRESSALIQHMVSRRAGNVVELRNGLTRREIRPPSAPSLRPVLSATVVRTGLWCHCCNNQKVRERAGAEYQGQYLCNNCGVIFEQTA